MKVNLPQNIINDYLAKEFKRTLILLGKSGVSIPDEVIKEQEEDFAKEHDMDKSELGFLETYKSACQQSFKKEKLISEVKT